jgi:hypothetical protein
MRSLEDHQAALELLRTAAAVPFTVIAHEVIPGRSLMHSTTTAIAFAWTEQSPQKICSSPHGTCALHTILRAIDRQTRRRSMKARFIAQARLLLLLGIASIAAGCGAQPVQRPTASAALSPHAAGMAMSAKPPAGPFIIDTAKSSGQLLSEAMAVMSRDMTRAPMTENPDHDFASMMIPHHQGAIDMAKVEVLYGKDPVLRRLAQEIIVTQDSEIAVMRMQLPKLSSPSSIQH